VQRCAPALSSKRRRWCAEQSTAPTSDARNNSSIDSSTLSLSSFMAFSRCDPITLNPPRSRRVQLTSGNWTGPRWAKPSLFEFLARRFSERICLRYVYPCSTINMQRFSGPSCRRQSGEQRSFIKELTS
jgi:hypothetical protein